MKINIRRKLKAAGTALLVALIVCSVLCISITGYLTVAQQQNFLSARSQAWNMAITVVEAGIEEGCQHLNANPNNCGADGWANDGTWYTHTNTLASGNSYVVAACVTNLTQPVLICRAIINTPTMIYGSRSSPFMFATAGVRDANPVTVSRAVQVKCFRGSLFTKAMVARHQIDMNGQDILTDSFDSGNLYKSAYGRYNSAVFAGDNGDVASNDNIVNAVNIGQANIYGHVQTGPTGTAAVGAGGGVGSHAYQTSNPGTIEPNGQEGGNWYRHDSNFTIPITGLPYNTGFTPGGPQDVATVTYNVNSNYVAGASTPPNPPPWSGVRTNIVATNTTSSYPGFVPGLITNTILTTVACPNYPAAGTYIGTVTNVTQAFSDKNVPTNGCYIGTPTPHGGSAKFDYIGIVSYKYMAISGYSYPSFSYNYAQYATNAVWTTNHYDHVLTSGSYYYPSNLTGSTLIQGECTLVLPNGLNMSGSDQITLASGVGGIGGGKLTLYVGGTSASIGGNGVINQNGYA